MSTKVIDIREIQLRLQEVLSQVLAGAELILTDGTTPIARLVPVSARVAGLHTGAIWTSPDFDEPLSDEFWAGNV